MELLIEVGLGFLSLVLGAILTRIINILMVIIIGFKLGKKYDPSIHDTPLFQKKLLYFDAFNCGTIFAIVHVIMAFKYAVCPLFAFLLYLIFWFIYQNPWFSNSDDLIYNLYWGEDKWIQCKLKTINLLSYILILYILTQIIIYLNYNWK